MTKIVHFVRFGHININTTTFVSLGSLVWLGLKHSTITEQHAMNSEHALPGSYVVGASSQDREPEQLRVDEVKR